MDKKYLEEPSFKFYHAKGKALPIVFYNDEHEKIRSNIYMLAALQQMGLDLEEETGLMYPRIPSHLSVGDLVDKARMLGKIDEGMCLLLFCCLVMLLHLSIVLLGCKDYLFSLFLAIILL